MIIGTTPTHIFRNPLKASDISEVQILYAQNGELILEKITSDCEVQDNVIQVTLTQEDTFKFNDIDLVKIQLRVLTTVGTVLSMPPKRVSPVECLKHEVMT